MYVCICHAHVYIFTPPSPPFFRVIGHLVREIELTKYAGSSIVETAQSCDAEPGFSPTLPPTPTLTLHTTPYPNPYPHPNLTPTLRPRYPHTIPTVLHPTSFFPHPTPHSPPPYPPPARLAAAYQSGRCRCCTSRRDARVVRGGRVRPYPPLIPPLPTPRPPPHPPPNPSLLPPPYPPPLSPLTWSEAPG